jgi:hypothetical protein
MNASIVLITLLLRDKSFAAGPTVLILLHPNTLQLI